jgi:hypothetical protein
MEALCFSETSVTFYQSAQHNFEEDVIFRQHWCDNLKFRFCGEGVAL